MSGAPLFATDIWRIGVARAAAAELLAPGALAAAPIRWLDPGPPYTYLADPFGLWRDGVLHLFAEAYDYRTRHGVIDVLRLDRDLAPIDRRTCLAEPWHLSYPVVFEAEGATWLLPEAWRSGTLTLYRATDFPWSWTRAATLALDAPAIDPTPFRHEGRWWLAYAPGGGRIAARQGRLHLAFAERLAGPWRPHPANPVRIDRAGARPGGTPLTTGDGLVLPVQDCARTYGGALRLLRIRALTPTRFAAEPGARLEAPPAWAPFDRGLHTLAACGPVTLLDAKRILRGPGGRWLDLARLARRTVAR